MKTTAELPDPYYKTCPRCRETILAAGGFYKNGGTKDGFTAYCRSCVKRAQGEYLAKQSPDQKAAKNLADYRRRRSTPERRAVAAADTRRWADAHPEKAREYERRARAKTPPEQRRIRNQISNNRARALRAGVESNFHMTDWVEILAYFDKRCAYCKAEDALLDLDHLVPIGRGGANVRGNIVPACRPCNAQKWKRTIEEFLGLRGLTQGDLQAIRLTACGA